MKWFRDYLYIPLVRKLKFSRVSALLVVFFFNGLWHGASWTFILWGVLCGVLLIVDNKTIPYRRKLLRSIGLSHKMTVIKVLNGIMLFSMLVVILVFFRAPSIGHAGVYLKNMFTMSTSAINVYHDKFELLLSLTLIVFVQIVHYYKGNNRIYELICNRPQWLRWVLYIIFILVMVLFSVNRQNNFIYFQF